MECISGSSPVPRSRSVISSLPFSLTRKRNAKPIARWPALLCGNVAVALIVERRTMMNARAPFLKTRYGAYSHRDIPEADAEITRVGPGTPCGEYMRRFWQPVCFSDELGALPHRVRLLGEELVVFRAGSGRAGLLELH